MIEYLTQWMHAYFLHLGCWMSFMFGIHIHKNGIPENIEHLKPLFWSALCLSSILGLISSHSHLHYLNHFVK